MTTVEPRAEARPAPSPGWLRGPAFDIILVALPWVLFYVWITWSLGLGRAGVGLAALSPAAERKALGLAMIAALAATYVHRHYTFFVVYGDPGTFSQMARRFIVAPIVIFGAVAAAKLTSTDDRPAALSPWGILLVLTGAWNIWHTIQQRYGILRIYGGKARGGLETPAAARRDRALFWAMAAVTTGVVAGWRRQLFAGHGNAQRTREIVEPIATSMPGRALTALLVIGGLCAIAWWAQAEARASIAPSSRAARLWFAGSTVALFAVFIAHGPIVGYLCFGVAHALEYLAFVHHFGHAKLGARPSGSVAAVLLGRPLLSAPLLIGALLAAYFALKDAASTDAYLVYYTGTTLLHFLYDGWIWKVRKPAVGAPLGVEAQAAGG
ncbi:MAG: hypothetical protein U0359_20565 [Byssovorax sp.]